MSQRNPRLQFTDAELDSRLKEHIRRAEKAADKADKAHTKIPKKRKMVKRRMIDEQAVKGKLDQKAVPKDGTSPKEKPTPRLKFEEEKPAPPSKLTHAIQKTPVNLMSGALHREFREYEGKNVGVESAHKLESAVEMGGRLAESSYRSHKLKPYRETAKAESRLEKANIRALYEKSVRDDTQLASNPASRWHQKRAIKKEYAAAKRSGQTTVSAEKITSGAARKAKEKWAALARKNGKGIAVAMAFLLVILLLLNLLHSCTALVVGGMSSAGGSTYPAKDEDMLGAEAAYAALEAGLQNTLNNYEASGGYDEYRYDLDPIGRDPYVLIAILNALNQGEWTLADVQDTLEMLFERQYTLTEEVVTETRYRTETVTWEDENGNVQESSEEVPYDYTICTVMLDNFDLSHLPIYIMGEDQLSIYAIYMATLGNRPDLFPQSEYPNASVLKDYLDYDVPAEALEDETFAAMLHEAEKYLGYPYVWGGYNPNTSFDCSGFVSWVINHSGWNVGRLGAQGLYNICTPVSAANARPGDLVFFAGTYDTPGVSHVGIYVGNGMMIHCGDPISYADITTSYWQSHFYAYGRLP